MSASLAGRVVVITGAGGGIGAAVARAAARAGARVAVTDVDASAAERTAAEIVASGGRALEGGCDVTDESACKATMAAVIDRFGSIDVLVNNAGRTQLGNFADTGGDVFRQIFDVNLFGAVYATQAALPELLKRRGLVVVVSSVAGFAPLAGRSAYAGSKHALHGVFETLRAELVGTGVGVTMVCPGFTDTDIEAHALGAAQRRTVGRLARPEAVADAIVAAIEGRRRTVVLSSIGKASYWLSRWAPALYERAMLARMRS